MNFDDEGSAFSDATTQKYVLQTRLALPGPGYYAALIWINQILKPRTYVEIGVHHGESLQTTYEATRAIGIDPIQRITKPLSPNTRLFTMTSDEFFARHDLAEELGSDHFDLAFIDGLHVFEQALLDFINLERYAGPRSVIVLHDCIPADKVSSARTRTTAFYSGDVWKLALCLRQQRPELQMTIIPTPPTGLCLVSNLDRDSRRLVQQREAIVRRYIDFDFEDYQMLQRHMPPAIRNTKAAVKTYLDQALADVAVAGASSR